MSVTPLQLRLASARAQTDCLFAALSPGTIYDRPIPERHRLIFYFGHLDAFDWNHICAWALSEPRFHSEFDQLFEAGIDPESHQIPHDRPEDWPGFAEVLAYRNQVRSRVDELLLQAPEDIVNVALEHRLMHAETLAYLIHNLAYEKKVPTADVKSQRLSASSENGFSSGMVEIPGGLATLGRAHEDGFGWDNEFDEHFARVPAFRIDRRKVTNGEYLEFVKQGAKAPHFWTRHNGEWYLRGMFELIPLPLDWPVYVTQLEACEYAAAKGKALPSEAQFHRAAYGSNTGVEKEYPWGDELPTAEHGNFDFHSWDPLPVNATPAGDSAFGAAQMVGNGWEWTSSIFEPFPGFASLPNYPGYSANFFDGRHCVMKGGSPRTAACLLRRSFRNWFRPDYPYVYATFRCIEC